MMFYKTKCKNCDYCVKTKTLSGMKYKCSKTNEKVSKNYYCGKVPPLNISDVFDYKKGD